MCFVLVFARCLVHDLQDDLSVDVLRPPSWHPHQGPAGTAQHRLQISTRAAFFPLEIEMRAGMWEDMKTRPSSCSWSVGEECNRWKQEMMIEMFILT